MKMAQRWDYLSKDVSGCPFWEWLCLTDNSEKLAILNNFHDVIEYAPDCPIGGAIDSSHIEIDDLYCVAMPSF